VSVAGPKAATNVPHASLSNDNCSMTSGLSGSTTSTADAGNSHSHGDRSNFANSRRWTPSVASAAETTPCQMPTLAVRTVVGDGGGNRSTRSRI
jgi:hypothetical protein